MSAPVRSALAATLVVACTASTADAPAGLDDEVASLVELSRRSNAALMRGDVDRYRELLPIADDFTLMSPFGGEPSRGLRPERVEAMRRFFRGGDFRQEVVSTYRSPDVIVLAVIERSHVAVGGLPAQEWALRVTLVFRRDDGRWRLVHRHADPLVHGISLEHAAEHGRGVGHGKRGV